MVVVVEYFLKLNFYRKKRRNGRTTDDGTFRGPRIYRWKKTRHDRISRENNLQLIVDQHKKTTNTINSSKSKSTNRQP
jgi:hypothetical protein